MPIVGKEYTKRIDLDGYEEEAYVIINTNPKMDAWMGIETGDPGETTFVVLSKIIKEWNFTDEAGTILDITPTNLRNALSAFDIVKIQESLGIAGLSDKKKDS